jgi:UDP-N-acetylenolpyruvoylglucosamine reductase
MSIFNRYSVVCHPCYANVALYVAKTLYTRRYMDVNTNISLKEYTTMQLGGPARFMADITSKEDLVGLITRTESQKIPYFVLGGGSNVIVSDEGFDGVVLLNKIMGFDIVEDKLHFTTIKIGAGENWDKVVQRTVGMQLSGIECLSGIPGTVGATPVQNVGAYGQEISDTLFELEAYDTASKQFVVLSKEECGFSYRNSIFKPTENRHYIIVSITLRLRKGVPEAPITRRKLYERQSWQFERPNYLIQFSFQTLVHFLKILSLKSGCLKTLKNVFQMRLFMKWPMKPSSYLPGG